MVTALRFAERYGLRVWTECTYQDHNMSLAARAAGPDGVVVPARAARGVINTDDLASDARLLRCERGDDETRLVYQSAGGGIEAARRVAWCVGAMAHVAGNEVVISVPDNLPG